MNQKTKSVQLVLKFVGFIQDLQKNCKLKTFHKFNVFFFVQRSGEALTQL